MHAWPRRATEEKVEKKKIVEKENVDWMIKASKKLKTLKKKRKREKTSSSLTPFPFQQKVHEIDIDDDMEFPLLSSSRQNDKVENAKPIEKRKWKSSSSSFLQKAQSSSSKAPSSLIQKAQWAIDQLEKPNGIKNKTNVPLVQKVHVEKKDFVHVETLLELADNEVLVEASENIIEEDDTWGFADEIDMEKKKPIDVKGMNNIEVEEPQEVKTGSTISTNFVRLHMRKRFKGSSGKPKKLPSYLRNSSASEMDPSFKKKQHGKKSKMLSQNLTTGIDIISECLQVAESGIIDASAIASIPATSAPATSTSVTLYPVKTVEVPPPKCHDHQFPTKLLLVKKKGVNKGREFYACSRGYDEGRCDFFQWADENAQMAAETFRNALVIDEKVAAERQEVLDTVESIGNGKASIEWKAAEKIKLLQLVFKHAKFREGQEWAIARTLQQQSSFVVLPTGTGKSLIYQFPSVLAPNTLTLVISPLVSLMTDQLSHLPKGLVGATLSGKQSSKETALTLKRLHARLIQILFISPERLVSASFQRLFKTAGYLPPIQFACIDEAHCLSEWSHNFRPSYLRMNRILRNVLKVPCIVALTATASITVQNQICDMLNICPSEGKWCSDWYRSNLKIHVKTVTDDQRYVHLVEALKSATSEFAFHKGAIIVYVHQKMHADNVASILLENGIKAASYHAGKDADERSSIQKRFMTGRVRVIVATVSFGMGIDKRNVRGVIHFHMPSTLEHFVQEIGRAGRDGKTSHTLLYLADEDARRFHSLAHSSFAAPATTTRFIHRVLQPSILSKTDYEHMAIAVEDNNGTTMHVNMSKSWLEEQYDIQDSVLETLLTLIEQKYDDLLTLEPSLCTRCVITLPTKSARHLSTEPLFTVLGSTQYDWIVTEAYGEGYATGTKYTCNLLPLSRILDMSIETCIRSIRKIQTSGHWTYELTDYSYSYILHKEPSLELISSIVHELQKKVAELEECSLRRVLTTYNAFQSACIPSEKEEDEEEESSGASTLISTISAYFENDQESATEMIIPSSLFEPIPDRLETNIRRDARILLSDPRLSSLGDIVTYRTIVRIFHQLSSPRFASSEWRLDSFWGKYKEFCFEEVGKLIFPIFQESRYYNTNAAQKIATGEEC